MTIPEIIDAHSDEINNLVDSILNDSSTFIKPGQKSVLYVRLGNSNNKAAGEALLRNCLNDFEGNNRIELYHALKNEVEDNVIFKLDDRFLPVESRSMFYHIGQGLMNAMFLIDNIHVNSVHWDYGGIVELNVSIDYSIRIYDCGSNTTAEIPEEKIGVLNDFLNDCREFANNAFDQSRSNPRPLVEYLYISHFHTDHVNGIEILGNLCQIQNVVLSYTDGVQKVTGIVSRMNDDVENGSNIFDIDSCRQEMFPEATIVDMLKNQKLDVNIIELNELNKKNPNLKKLNEATGNLGHNLLYDPAQSYDINNGTNTIHVYHAYPDPEVFNSENSLSYYLSDTKSWVFLLMNYVPSGADYYELHNAFLKMLCSEFSDIPESDKDENWSKMVFEILKSEPGRAAIRGIYEELWGGGDLNETSLCLALAPKDCVDSQKEDYIIEPNCLLGNYFINDISVVCPTILLTGDSVLHADCGGDHPFYDEILSVLDNYNFPMIKVILLPHHGSCGNISEEGFYDLSTWKGNEKTFWVVSYGKDNHYGHPNQPPCNWIGTHKCVQYNSDPSNMTFPDEEGEIISDVLLTDDGGQELINSHVLFHCHDMSKIYVRIHHAVKNN